MLFADLVGSTALGEQQDPERTRALLERFYDAMADEIGRAGGTVEKFAGDAVMAVFGVPEAHEDHAERALHAALAMQRRLGADFDGVLALRIGVDTGEVVVGRAREGSSFVTGDAVNVAARLEQASEPGAIVVGARTAEAVRGAFELGPAFEVDAKGKSEPVVAQTLVRALTLMRPRGPARRRAGVRRARHGARAAAGDLPPRRRAAGAARRDADGRRRRRQDDARPRALALALRAGAAAAAAHRPLPRLRPHHLLGARRDPPRAARDPRERGAGGRAAPARRPRDPRPRPRPRRRRRRPSAGRSRALPGSLGRPAERADGRDADGRPRRGPALGRGSAARPARAGLARRARAAARDRHGASRAARPPAGVGRRPPQRLARLAGRALAGRVGGDARRARARRALARDPAGAGRAGRGQPVLPRGAARGLRRDGHGGRGAARLGPGDPLGARRPAGGRPTRRPCRRRP